MTDDRRHERLVDLWTDAATDDETKRAFLTDAADAALEGEARDLERLWDRLGDALGGPAPSPEESRRMLRAVRGRVERRPARWLPAAAAVVLAFGLGWLGRGASAPVESDPRSEYMLVIRGGAPGGTDGSAAAMAAWAVELSQGRRLVDASELDDRATRWVGADPGGEARGPALGGYFLIRAASLDEAVALARESPHLRAGGDASVEVLPLVRGGGGGERP